jgi:hypothetical protein
MKPAPIALLLLFLAGCASYRPPVTPIGQEAQAARCQIVAKAEADRLPGERRAALAKARDSSVPLEIALGVLKLVDPVNVALLVLLGPPALVVGAVQAKKTYAADYQSRYEACMSPCRTGFCEKSCDATTFMMPEPDDHWAVRR